MKTIIHGPQACGKTRNAQALARHFHCKAIVDDWDGASSVPANALVLTCLPAEEIGQPPGAQVLSFDAAARLAGLATGAAA